jgi:sulfur relay (sulfurtransferase) DsrC/TusE family protein
MLSMVKVSSNRPLDALLEVMSIEDIPETLGGKFKIKDESFPFNLAENGPLWYPAFQPPHTLVDDRHDAISRAEPSAEAKATVAALKKVSFATDIPRPIYVSEVSPGNRKSPRAAASQPEITPPVDHVNALLEYFKAKSSPLFNLQVPTISPEAWDEAQASLMIENAQAKAAESINEVLDYIQTQNETFFQQPHSTRRLSVSSIMETAQATLHSDAAIKLTDYIPNPILPFQVNESTNDESSLRTPINEVLDSPLFNLQVPSIGPEAWDEAKASLMIENAQAKATESINEVLDYIQTQNEQFFQQPSSTRRLSVSSIMEATLQSDPAIKLADYLQHPILPFQVHDDTNANKPQIAESPPISDIFNIFHSTPTPSLSDVSRLSHDESLAATPDESETSDRSLLGFLKKQDESLREFSTSFQADMLRPWVDSLTAAPSSEMPNQPHPLLLYLQTQNAKLVESLSSSPIFNGEHSMNNASGIDLANYFKAQNQELLTSLAEKLDPNIASEAIAYIKNQNQQLLETLSSMNASSRNSVSSLDGQKNIEELAQYLRTQQEVFEEQLHAFLNKNQSSPNAEHRSASPPEDIITYIQSLRSPLFKEI